MNNPTGFSTPWTCQKDSDTINAVDASGTMTGIYADLQDDPSVGIFGDPAGAKLALDYAVHCVNNFTALTEVLAELLESPNAKQNALWDKARTVLGNSVFPEPEYPELIFDDEDTPGKYSLEEFADEPEDYNPAKG